MSCSRNSKSGTSPGLSANDIAAKLRKRCREEIRDALVTFFGAPPIDGLGTTGGFKIMIEDRGNLGLARAAACQRPDRGQGQRHARTARRLQQLARQHPLALPRHRPHQMHGAGHFAQRRLQHAAGLSRLVLREQLQRVRPIVAGQRHGRHCGFATVSSRSSSSRWPTTRARWSRWRRCSAIRDTSGPRDADALQHVRGHGRHRQLDAGHQFGRRHRPGGEDQQRRNCPPRWPTTGPS